MTTFAFASTPPRLREAMIGRALGDARERAGLTQATAARKAGMPQSTLAEIETGQRPVRLSEVLTFLDLYGLRLEALDVRGRDAGFAKVKRGRGRPRKALPEVSFSSDLEATGRIDLLFDQVRLLQPLRQLEQFDDALDELAALILRLSTSPRFARHAPAIKAILGAARGWIDPATGDLFDPVGLTGIARDLLKDRTSPRDVLLS